MGLPDFSYLTPKSLGEAAALLGQGGGSLVVGGGTDLLPAMRHGLVRPGALVSLADVPELRTLAEEADGTLRIGASVKVRALETSSLVAKRFPMLRQAAHAVGSPQLRQMGTVAGNLLLEPRCCYYNRSAFWRSSRPACLKVGGQVCNAVGSRTKCFAAFSGDLAPALIALQAQAQIVSAHGERSLPLEDLYTGDGLRPFTLAPGEILGSVKVPPPPAGSAGLYAKRRLRDSIDFPLVSCALVRGPSDGSGDDGTRVVLGAVSSGPVVVEGIAETLATTRTESGADTDDRDAAALAALAWKQARPVENAIGVTAPWRRSEVRTMVGEAWAALHPSRRHDAREESR